MKYIPELDGLRAISVISVVIYHAQFSIWGVPLFSVGYLGVDVFFVISGYIITRMLLLETGMSTFSISSFYERRIRRLIPPLLVVILFSLFMGMATLLPSAFADLSATALAALGFAANLYFFSTADYFSEAGEYMPLLHTWSLAVEEQFYLIYPLFVIWFLRPTHRSWLLAVLIVSFAASFLATVAVLERSPEAAFYLPFFRAWQLIAGAIVAVTFNDHQKASSAAAVAASIGLILILGAVLIPFSSSQLPYLGNVFAVLGAALVIAYSGGAFWVKKLLSMKPLVFLGLISYSLYLWHQPIFVFARLYAVNELGQGVKFLLVGLSFAAAAGSWRFIELPARDRGKLEWATLRNILFLGISLISALSFAGLWTGGLPLRFTEAELRLVSVEAERGTLVLSGQDCKTASLNQICHIGSAAGEPTWALLGDSHAETLADALSSYLMSKGSAGIVLTYPACPFILGITPVATDEDCLEFTQAALEVIRRRQISTVVINDRSTAYLLGTRFDNKEGGVEPGLPFPVKVPGPDGNEIQRIDAVTSRLSQTIEKLLSLGLRVIYIAPVPEVGWHLPRTVIKLIGSGQLPLTTSREVYLERHKITLSIMKSFEGRSNFIPIYMDDVFCSMTDNRCRTHSDDRLFYTDTDHLSRDGARLVIQRMQQVLDR
jgi:peptidoglycan/LPS O-acetylase OafA/YrhL